MSNARSPQTRGGNGRAANTRFVEVEMPASVSGHMVIELRGGGRILLSEPTHVTLLVRLLRSIGCEGQGGRL